MLKIINSGYSGYMGRVITDIAEADRDVKIVAGLDLNTDVRADYPVFKNLREFHDAADVVIDFSHPSALDGLLAYCITKVMPLVLCTTGYTAQQLEAIEIASKKMPIFRSGNMSVGINLLSELIKRAAQTLGDDFDIEIVEKHHRRKVDAPSGTALMLSDAVASGLAYEPELVYERESVRKARSAGEIGISAVRGGTIVGIHEVIFAGQDEVIELRHTAASRDIFALGAMRAAKFMAGKTSGLYNMKDVLC
ncbi:MAG: 4-hydroxy-tetrahydrodipicolinate reductase [Oscillospiraceae bacterium]|nr:4-hydroxy-tetrahydrodipicolinate reductase [Oscillospiraceae bacterium]MCL2279039.1 4-hydroxy-tetrahydrodipicolinate reductase [Oscillospiraceae bacterium]